MLRCLGIYIEEALLLHILLTVGGAMAALSVLDRGTHVPMLSVALCATPFFVVEGYSGYAPDLCKNLR